MQRVEDNGMISTESATGVTRDVNALTIFISYSRADMAAADAMVSTLECNGFAVIIDRRDLPYGEEWQKELADFIAASDTVVWLVSPYSVRSKWCNWELGEVSRLSKRLVPVVVRTTDPDSLPEALGKIHLLPAEGKYDASRHEADLVNVLNTDRDWLKKATSLGGVAREWASKDRDRARLLRGRALSEAEAWSIRAPRGAPAPTSDILELILASRRTQRRAQRTMVTGSIAAAIVAIGLAATAVWFGVRAEEQAAEAERQRIVAESNEERALAQEAEASRQREVAQQNEERAKSERNAALASEANRIAGISKPYLSSGRPDIAMALALDVAPRSQEDDAPLSKDLEIVLRRAFEQTIAPVERRTADNAFQVAVSANGRWVAVGTAGDAQKGMVHVFDAVTLKEHVRFQAMDDFVTSLEFSRESDSLAVAGGRAPAIWDVQTGKQRFPLVLPEGTGGFTKAVRYSPDGTYLALTTNRHAAFVFDAHTGALLHELPGVDFEDMRARVAEQIERADDPATMMYSQAIWAMYGTATDVAISPDSSLIAITGPTAIDGSVQVFDARTGELKRLLTGGTVAIVAAPQTQAAEILAFSPDSKTIFASPLPQTIKAWTVDDGVLRSETQARDINTFTISPDGRVIISGHNDGSVVIRCMEAFLETVALQAHSDTVQAIRTDNERGLMISTSADGTAKLWRLPKTEEICLDPSSSDSTEPIAAMRPFWVLPGNRSPVFDAAFSPDGRSVFTVSQDAALRAWQIPRSTVKANGAGFPLLTSADSD